MHLGDIHTSIVMIMYNDKMHTIMYVGIYTKVRNCSLFTDKATRKHFITKQDVRKKGFRQSVMRHKAR